MHYCKSIRDVYRSKITKKIALLSKYFWASLFTWLNIADNRRTGCAGWQQEMLSVSYSFAVQCAQSNELSLSEPTSCCSRSSSNVDTLRLIVPLCWLPAALISVWVLGEHDIVERAEMTECVCESVCVCVREREGVNSIPTVEMAFKCISLCTQTALQTHYLGAHVCVSTSSCAHVCVATLQMCFQAIPPIVSMLPRDSTLYLSVPIPFSFIMPPFLSSCQRSLLRCNLAPAVL